MIALSIIVPVYNVAKYLPTCLDSISSQLTATVEVILVDDGSTDDSYSICAYYAQRFDSFKIVRQQNKGLSSARNTGMLQASGQFVWFVDSDDWIAVGSIQELLNKIANSPETDVMRFGFTLFDDGTNKFVEEYSYQEQQNVCSNTYFQKNEMLYQAWAGIYKRSFLRVNNISFPEGMIYEDIPYNLLVYTASAKMTILPQKYYWYRVRQGSLLRSEVTLKKIVSVAHILKVCDDLIEKFADNKKEVTIAIRKKLDYLYVFIDHLYEYDGYTAKEKEAAFNQLNLDIPILLGESKGIVFTKLVLKWTPRLFYKKRLRYLKKQSH